MEEKQSSDASVVIGLTERWEFGGFWCFVVVASCLMTPGLDSSAL